MKTWALLVRTGSLLDGANDRRIAQADVTATVTLPGGPSVTKRLEAMDVGGQPSFGNFFPMGDPRAASAEFEYRVPAGGR